MRLSSGKIGKCALSVKDKADGRESSIRPVAPVLMVSGPAVIDRFAKYEFIVAAQLVVVSPLALPG